MEYYNIAEKIEILTQTILFGFGLSVFVGLLSWAITSAFRLINKIIR